MEWTKNQQNAIERACNFLDATSASDHARIVIMDLLDEISSYAHRVEQLQKIIDSRPAINAALPQSYIDWSRSIYEVEAIRLERLTSN